MSLFVRMMDMAGGFRQYVRVSWDDPANKVTLNVLHALLNKPWSPLTEYLGAIYRGCVAICTDEESREACTPHKVQPHVDESK